MIKTETPTEVYYSITKDVRRINALRGGARSSKTRSLIQVAMKWLIEGKIGDQVITTETIDGSQLPLNKGTFLICRETMPALKRTVEKEFINVLLDTGWAPFIEHRKSVHEFRYKGREVIFMSLDDETKVLGMETAFFWLNEGNKVPFETFNQLLRRCLGCCFLDYNPFDPGGWLREEIEINRSEKIGDVSLNVSTYKMNPHLPKVLIQEYENYKETNPAAYKVYAQGEWAKLSGLIYPNWNYWDVEESELNGASMCYGIDFGYNHATTIVKAFKVENKLYWKQILYEYRLTPQDVIQWLRSVNFSRTAKIFGDDARPDAIDEIRKAGYNCRPAKKKKVKAGIDIVKSYHLFVEGNELISEIKMYRWKEDKENIEDSREGITDEPIKRFDDGMDAGRYATLFLHRKSKFKIMG